MTNSDGMTTEGEVEAAYAAAERAYYATMVTHNSQTIGEFAANRRECLRAAVRAALSAAASVRHAPDGAARMRERAANLAYVRGTQEAMDIAADIRALPYEGNFPAPGSSWVR